MAAVADATLHETAWLRQAYARGRWLWLYKAIGTPVAMAAFLVVYFLLLRHPVFPVTTMPVTVVDRLIPFQPWSIVPYASLWLYISLAAVLLHTRRELVAYLTAVGIVTCSGFLIFLLWPTVIPDPHIDWARHPSVEFLKSVDAAGNACPSLHAAFVALSCVWLHRQLRETVAPRWLRTLNIVWCLLVLYSTLATKQHVFVDLAAGTVLGLGVALALLACLPRPQHPASNLQPDMHWAGAQPPPKPGHCQPPVKIPAGNGKPQRLR